MLRKIKRIQPYDINWDSVSRDGNYYVVNVGNKATILFLHKEIAVTNFQAKEYIYKYNLPKNCGTPISGFINATQWRVRASRVTFPSDTQVQIVTAISESTSDGTASDPYYNNFDLVIFCVKQHSVSQCKIYCGAIVTSEWSNSEVCLFKNADFKDKFGREFDNSCDAIAVMNGDGNAQGGAFYQVRYYPSSKNIWVSTNITNQGAIRLNYIAVLGWQYSVSHKANTGVYFPSSITSGRTFENCTTRYGNIIFLTFNCSVNVWSSWEKWNIGTAPKPIGNTWAHGMAFYQTGSVAPVPMDAYVTDSGLIYVQNKSGLSLGEGWLFANIVYACVQTKRLTDDKSYPYIHKQQ